MDGMFYRGKSDHQADFQDPPPKIVRLLAITVVAAVGIVGMLMLLRWAGVDVALPIEFPSIGG